MDCDGLPPAARHRRARGTAASAQPPGRASSPIASPGGGGRATNGMKRNDDDPIGAFGCTWQEFDHAATRSIGSLYSEATFGGGALRSRRRTAASATHVARGMRGSVYATARGRGERAGNTRGRSPRRWYNSEMGTLPQGGSCKQLPALVCTLAAAITVCIGTSPGGRPMAGMDRRARGGRERVRLETHSGGRLGRAGGQ